MTKTPTGLAIAAWLAASLFSAAAAQTSFAPAAVVNDDIITYYDVEQRASLMRLNGAESSPRLNRAALEDLIDDRLRAQAGEQFQLAASEDQVAAGVEEFAQRYNTDGAGLSGRLRSLGVDRAALVDLIRAQVVWRDLVTRRYGPRATPSEIELDQEIALAASGRTRAFRLAEIAIPASPGNEAQASATMERVLGQLRAGGDFAALARKFSRTPSARNGGDVGWVPETTMPPDLAEIIAATAPGAVTQPYVVPGGISIYRVSESREESPPWAREAQVSLRKISIAGDDEDAMARAKEIRDDVEGCGSIPALSGQETMESIDTKIVNALPTPVRGVVRLLEAGEASRPLQAEGRTEIFVVCDRSGGVDAETRARLREQIRSRRMTRLADGYLQELRREAVIERR